MRVPAGYLSLSGLCPVGKGECQFIIEKRYIDNLYKYGPVWKFYDMHVMKEVLRSPAVIFSGLKRDEYECGYCYSGVVSKRVRPPRQVGDKPVELAPPPGMVGVVFVRPDHRGNIILDWDWRNEHPDTAGWPRTWTEDFEGVKWQKT